MPLGNTTGSGTHGGEKTRRVLQHLLKAAEILGVVSNSQGSLGTCDNKACIGYIGLVYLPTCASFLW